MKTLAERFAWARQQKGLKKIEIAAAIGISPASVTQIEDGRTRNLKASTLIGCQKATGVRAEWIATGKGPRLVEHDSQIDRIVSALKSLPPSHRDKIEQDILFLANLNEPQE